MLWKYNVAIGEDVILYYFMHDLQSLSQKGLRLYLV